MHWKIERTTGVFVLLVTIGCFLGAVQPAAADAALLAAASEPVTEEPRATDAEGFAAQATTAAPVAAADDGAAPVRFAVQFEGLAAGEEVVLSGPGGAGGTIEIPQNGALTLTLRPSSWGLAAPNGLAAGFTLRENASIDAVTGDAWTDGERLIVTREVRGSVSIHKTVRTASDQSVLYRLTSSTLDEQRALAFTADGPQTLTCTFWGLPAGTYTLTENGAFAAQLTITEDTRSVSIPLS